jgi:UDP-glucose 4-epimerase
LRALITGGAGFLGSHLYYLLELVESEPHSFDDMSAGTVRHQNAIVGSVLDKEALDKATSQVDPDIIFHLAAIVGPRTANEHLTRSTIIRGTKNIVDICTKREIFLFNFSSALVYSGSGQQSETSVKRPKGAYGKSKLLAEKVIQKAHEENGLRYLTVRPFNVYGPGQEGGPLGYVIPRFIESAKAGTPLEICGNGSHERDFIYVDDFMRAILQLWYHGKTNTEYNVCTGVGTSIRSLAESIIQVCQSKSGVEFTEDRDEVERLVGSNEKIQKATGWLPSYSLTDGLWRAANE